MPAMGVLGALSLLLLMVLTGTDQLKQLYVSAGTLAIGIAVAVISKRWQAT